MPVGDGCKAVVRMRGGFTPVPETLVTWAVGAARSLVMYVEGYELKGCGWGMPMEVGASL
jgi:hypothetical protein